jgi:nucleoside-diphosphate-sugar epimerase
MNPLVFVAGATGYTGSALVSCLRTQGVATTAHVRPDSSKLEVFRARFEAEGAEVDTTPWDLDAMTQTLRARAPTHVFALLGTTRRRGAQDPSATYATVDYGLTKLLLDACVASGHRPRFVYLSSMGVGPKARGAYLSLRHKLETELAASGLPFTIVRPAFITGDDRGETRVGERVGAVISDGVFAALDLFGAGLTRRYGSLTGAQLAAALARAAFDPASEGRTLEREGLA